MSGLGIVLEEAESSVSQRSHVSVTLSQSPKLDYSDSEPLLPPLPDTAADTALSQRNTSGSPVMATRALMLLPAPSLTGETTLQEPQAPEQPHVLSNIFLDQLFELYELYEFDLLALHADIMPLTFAPQEPLPPSHNTLPLKRLKSLKNGMRKLSLLKGTPPAELPPSIGLPPPRPVLLPTHTQADLSLLSSAGDSLPNSMFSTAATVAVVHHAHSNSQSLASARRRTLLGSRCTLAATTPPLPLPIITLSENLSTTRENIEGVEQTFFDRVGVDDGHSDDDKLSRLTTLAELIEYLLYLNEHKHAVSNAYDATRERLVSLGWCLAHDLENLELQRDVALSQIDTKLLQIEEKLNSEFLILMLNNTALQITGKRLSAATSRDTLLSPSLKVLESRCYTFGNAP